ncbi:hypothetical protein ARMSODRAFT_983262 [Armillaria solidipes]|uniref:CxC2-like cysteine cluster KDZ transposase-associated domain-containing protein n=1 Tax=Armillaria solidipes TaxID=1076256 RepID=A0A2H3AJR6_9AGAR|nr:hypothetical protein ARMSODRAFT_983262 [Armillaria solidipes]
MTNAVLIASRGLEMALMPCPLRNLGAVTASWTISFVRRAAFDVIVENRYTGYRLPIAGHQEFKVLHGNGVHHIALDYCGCERQLPKHIQLLRRGWYPTSQRVPRTAASFQLLEFLHLLSLCAKTSVYDFYRTLEKLTTNTGMGVPKSRYKALMRMLLQWRHLKMLKRAGRGHVDNGVNTTQDHDLVVKCPSCPWPEVNLPEGWDQAPPEMQFLYVLLICMDANFRLKNQMVSSYSRDPGLGIGWGYFVPRAPFETYVLNHTSDEDISTCVGFAALAKADTKFSKGLRYTGVGAVSCARGEFLMRLVDLHKGERYAPMDYVFGSALQPFAGLLSMIISYDIACQWFVHLDERMKNWPEEIPPPSAKLTPAIPKFHEPAHKQDNHQEFSCNYIKGMAASDCEVPERIWGPNNAIGNSTKTMGPGSRHDVLDDNFGAWNWQKYTGMAAVKERNVQVEGHRGFTAALPQNLVEDWERMCVKWENDSFPKTAENPFATNEDYMSEDEVEKELQAEEEERRRQGGRVYHETSAHKFVALGLSLEESQRKIRSLALQHKNPTTRQGAALKEERSILQEKLRSWLLLRPIYIPGLVQYLTETGELSSNSEDENPEDVALWLPSSLPVERRRAICMEGLPRMEDKFRTAQCHDALNGIRHTLRVKTRMIYFRNKNTRGQAPSTRARAVIDGVHKRALRFASKYRSAREAKLALAGPGDWERTLRVLENKDIRSYTDVERKSRGPGRRGNNEDDDEPVHASDDDEEDEITLEVTERTQKEGTGETRRTLSWIWQTTPVDIEDGADNNEKILQTEWCKSRARSKRSSEEVLLLREEMRRVLKFLEWKGQWWRERQGARGIDGDDGLAEGLASYAQDQEALQTRLMQTFEALWKTPLEDLEHESDGEDEDSTVDDSSDSSDDEDGEPE